MSIYAEKRKGRLTGVFVVEVEDQGKRLRARAKSMDEAKEIERAMERGRWEGAAKLPKATDDRLTLDGLYKAAVFNGWKQRQAHQQRDYRIVEWCIDLLGRDTAVDDINLNHFKRIRDARVTQGNLLQTADRYLSALQSLITWGRSNVDAKGRPYTNNNPSVCRSGIVRERTEWFTAEDQERLIQTMVANGHMAEAVCCLAYGQTGMRANELLTVKPDQIRDDVIILWDQKNKRWGEGVPVQPEVARALRTIIERNALPSYGVMADRFKKAAQSLGYKVNMRLPQIKGGGVVRQRRSTLDTVSLHTLRHSTATRLILDGENPAVVQEYMRHSSWATTRKYLKLTGAPKRNALGRLALKTDNAMVNRLLYGAGERGETAGEFREFGDDSRTSVHNAHPNSSMISMGMVPEGGIEPPTQRFSVLGEIPNKTDETDS